MPRDKLINYAETLLKESKYLDFKSHFDVSSTTEWCEITKDIIAMANSGGGIILFGINDDGTVVKNFDKEKVYKLDTALISEKISKYLDVDFTEFEILEFKRGKSKVAGFYIAPTEIPYVFAKNGIQINDGKKFKSIFAEGTIYYRRGAKSRPGNTTQLNHHRLEAGGFKVLQDSGLKPRSSSGH